MHQHTLTLPSKEDHPMPGQWHWWASHDGEHFTIGPCASRDDAIAEATFDLLGEDNDGNLHFTIQEAQDNNVDLSKYFYADDFLGHAAEAMNEDDCGSDEDGRNGPLDAVTPAQTLDLEARVCAAIREWQKDHKLPLRSYWFGATRNTEDVSIPADQQGREIWMPREA